MSVRSRCRERIDAAEWFDQARLSPALVARYLWDLEKVNRYLLGARAVLVHLAPLLADGGSAPLRVLDLGCGGGEVLRALAVRARKRRRPLLGIGLDRNPLVVAYARYRARAFPELSWICADISALPLAPGSMDAVISTTMLHHLDPGQVVDLLRRARAVARGWLVISDLIRSYAALTAYRVFSRLAGFDESTRYDGQVSVRRAYRPEEFAGLAAAAGLIHWRIHRHPFDRMTLVVGPPGAGES
jgi:SAM-dependent methyltransferase